MKSPQDTDCKSIELESAGLTNGTLSNLRQFGYDVNYDEEDDVYRVGNYTEEDDGVF